MAPFRHYGRFAALFGAAISTAIASARTREARLLAATWERDLAGAHFLFLGGRTSDAARAVLVNGATMHAADYDDTHQAAVVHPSGAVLPAVLASAESRDVSIGEVVAAYACGLETLIRLAIQTPGEYHRHGFHATGVCGAVGAAVGAAVIEGRSQELVRRAAMIASMHGGGTFEYIRSGGNAKIVYPGLAARWGIEAVRMAVSGFQPPLEAVEGAFGLVAVHTGGRAARFDVVTARDLDGATLMSAGTAIKSHPCCYFSQVYLDAARVAVGAPDPLDAAAVDEVVCEGPRETIEVLFEPHEQRVHPGDPYDAKFALPFQIAALLVRGDVDMTTFTDESLADPEVARLAEHVTGRVTEELGDYPEHMPARVTLRLRDGTTRCAALPAALGASPWALDSPFIAQRFARDIGAGGDALRTVLARPEHRAALVWELVARIVAGAVPAET